MERDRERWDERYAGRPLAHAAPPDALSGDDELLSLVPTAGRAADIACGVGAQTLWLARRGLAQRRCMFDAVFCHGAEGATGDNLFFSPYSISNAMAMTAARRCSCPPLTWCGYLAPMCSGSGRRMRVARSTICASACARGMTL